MGATTMAEEKMITSKAVCDWLGISKATLSELVNHPDPEKRLPSFKWGQRYRFSPSEVRDWLVRSKYVPVATQPQENSVDDEDEDE